MGWAVFFWVTTGVTVVETFTQVGNKKTIVASPQTKPMRDFCNESLLISLQHVLDDPDLLLQYKQFLQGELSLENILFWEDIEKLKLMEQEANREEYKRIFDIYFTKGSALELNLRTDIIATVARRMEQEEIDPSIFAEAQEATYHLLRADSFLRFKRHLKNNTV
jgi:hypothetical protein